MSRAAGLCRRCGGPKRGRAARSSTAVVDCGWCRDSVCAKHAVWRDGYYLCSKCARKGAQPEP